MLANYGYSDGSGSYFITIDTDKCNGCGDCVDACPAKVFQVVDQDPNDPLSEEPVAIVDPDKKKKLKYECGPCKPASDRPPLPCVQACKERAIAHSWWGEDLKRPETSCGGLVQGLAVLEDEEVP